MTFSPRGSRLNHKTRRAARERHTAFASCTIFDTKAAKLGVNQGAQARLGKPTKQTMGASASLIDQVIPNPSRCRIVHKIAAGGGDRTKGASSPDSHIQGTQGCCPTGHVFGNGHRIGHFAYEGGIWPRKGGGLYRGRRRTDKPPGSLHRWPALCRI